MQKQLYLVIIALALMSGSVSAQTHLNLAGQFGIPLNDFRDNTDAVGGGFRAGLYFPFAPTVPVYFGLDFGYMVYGSNTQFINETLQLFDSQGNPIGRGFQINLRSRTNNNLLNGHAVLRLKAPLATIQPYVDGLIGFNYLYTRTKIFDDSPECYFCDDPDGSNVIEAQTQQESFVLSYGGALGMQIKLGESISLDVRGIYLIGGEAEYFDRSQTENWSITFTGNDPNAPDPNEVSLNSPDGTPKKSETDMFQGTIGLTINF